MAEISSNEHVVIAGQTGSGKTFLSRYLTRPLPRLIVLDSKDELADWNVVDFDDEAQGRLMEGENVRARVVPPIGEDPGAHWEAAFEFALTCGNLTIFIDEAFAVFENAVSATPNARAIWTRGRSLGIGAWACTQRPSGIPLFVISESKHQFCFYLQLAKDRSRMSEYMGEEVLDAVPDEHGFWYHTNRRGAIYYPELLLPPTVKAPRGAKEPA